MVDPEHHPPGDGETATRESGDRQDSARSSGRFWILVIAAVSLGSIGCMCAFIFIAVA